MAQFPAPEAGMVLTHFIVSDDVERSRRFYVDVLGGESVREGEPSVVALANSWVIINVGGGPTDDKPTVTLESPRGRDRTSSFLNIRVADIDKIYADWSARGAEFLTPPVDHGHEIRCFLRRRGDRLSSIATPAEAFLPVLAFAGAAVVTTRSCKRSRGEARCYVLSSDASLAAARRRCEWHSLAPPRAHRAGKAYAGLEVTLRVVGPNRRWRRTLRRWGSRSAREPAA
jgi:catechol 2,3-dioxygenase-like lactoylglutathione lyase family enzyme